VLGWLGRLRREERSVLYCVGWIGLDWIGPGRLDGRLSFAQANFPFIGWVGGPSSLLTDHFWAVGLPSLLFSYSYSHAYCTIERESRRQSPFHHRCHRCLSLFYSTGTFNASFSREETLAETQRHLQSDGLPVHQRRTHLNYAYVACAM